MAHDDHKRAAAGAALEHVLSGMKLGLGSGSTAEHFVKLLGAHAKAKRLDLLCVPTSEATRRLAVEAGLRVTTLDEHPELDLTIDGADEIDPQVRLIKGGGGALTREKIVASASARMIVIADSSKKVAKLGKFPLPIEVLPFGLKATLQALDECDMITDMPSRKVLRLGRDGKPFVTENGNLIVDAHYRTIAEPELLSGILKMVTGVVEHGLFDDLADTAIIAGPGGIETLIAPDDLPVLDFGSDGEEALEAAVMRAIEDDLMEPDPPVKRKR